MLNKTSSYYKPKEIDFTVMGVDDIMSSFLNDCIRHRENLEFIFQCRVLEKASQQSVLHLDHLRIIRQIDDVIHHKKI
jgi:hypothetical protein